MSKLDGFMQLLSGHFNNSQQFESLRDTEPDFPYAEHVNTVCNDKIIHLPDSFNGYFLVEESYYTVNGNTHSCITEYILSAGKS